MEYGLIAEKLGHSFSKEVHGFLADYDYRLQELTLEELDTFMREKDFKAINVTIPYKEKVIPYLYEIDSAAQTIGSVNTIVNKDGKLYGYNTDFLGMRSMIVGSGIEIKDKKVLILGSGGTSKTAFYVCEDLGAKEILTVSRTKSNKTITYDEVYKYHLDAQVIVNTTPCGMFPDIDSMPIDVKPFKDLHGVVDAIYNPLKTALALSAEKQGAKSVCGLYMLVAQAVYACEKFLNKEIDKSEIDRVYSKALRSKQNIVLIGMPSCGKSTVGKLIAEKLNRKFYDTDSIIEEKTGRTCSEIINNDGEEAFRKIESQVIFVVSKLSEAVIATGGGAILKEENRLNLHKNGLLWFIDRPLEKLITTADRPLSSDREALLKRYNERYPVYCQTADYKISGDRSAKETALLIEKDMSV